MLQGSCGVRGVPAAARDICPIAEDDVVFPHTHDDEGGRSSADGGRHPFLFSGERGPESIGTPPSPRGGERSRSPEGMIG